MRRHIYWCCTSTKEGFGELVVAKWKYFFYHKGHPNELSTKCSHGELGKRKWIKIGSEPYDKLCAIGLHGTLLGDMSRLSPDVQTSSLEGFHSLLNYWHPKMIAYSYLGTVCRTILAILHFNENVKREKRRTKQGEVSYHITYPKFKLGDEVVRAIAVPPTYGYVEEMRGILFSLSKEDIEAMATRMAEYTAKVPEPLNRKFTEKNSREEAIAKWNARKVMQTDLFPPCKFCHYSY
ncbi:uncharacterized protein LOC135682938 [Rhopilema esculentum]|uniref:uncharacterized protein LOC135682938 n=1 Tax=Rhopilema esculentum TaxID=499914 RepID=UPI0031D2C061